MHLSFPLKFGLLHEHEQPEFADFKLCLSSLNLILLNGSADFKKLPVCVHWSDEGQTNHNVDLIFGTKIRSKMKKPWLANGQALLMVIYLVQSQYTEWEQAKHKFWHCIVTIQITIRPVYATNFHLHGHHLCKSLKKNVAGFAAIARVSVVWLPVYWTTLRKAGRMRSLGKHEDGMWTSFDFVKIVQWTPSSKKCSPH